ncbi:MAG: recombinase family protein [Dysosmobacter sp.]
MILLAFCRYRYHTSLFDRPAWQDIVTLIEAGLVRTLIVKDMSRLGREYLKVGELTELYFPSKGVRFIAVNDGVDSLVESSSDFNPVRNWANELHAKDTSRKVRSMKRMQAENGERLGGKPPYGYRKRDDDSKRLVPDEETRVSSSASSSSAPRGKGRIRSPAYCGMTMC